MILNNFKVFQMIQKENQMKYRLIKAVKSIIINLKYGCVKMIQRCIQHMMKANTLSQRDLLEN